jgi:O-antigen/teichoic acid export membrane protein
LAKTLPAVIRQIGAVAIGLGVLGFASFAFLSISGRVLGPAAFAPLATMWVLVNAAGPALFQPLEQEVGRAVAHRRALGMGGRPVYHRAGVLALGLVVLAAVCVALARGPLTDDVFAGHGVLVVALLVGLAGLGAEHLTRGAMAGGDLYRRYGGQLAIDGFLRLAGCVALAVAGSTVVGSYAFVLAGAPVLAVLVTMRRLGPATQPGPTAEWGQLSRAVGLLLAGSVLSQLVINAAPVAATALATESESARAGIFVSVLVLARVPLFLFAAIQAAFLPGLAALAAQGNRSGFQRRLGSILATVSALGVAGVVVIAGVGPWLVTLFYGSDFVTTRTDLIPLAAAAGFFMIASVFAQTMVAVQKYVPVVIGWAAGSATFFVGLLAPWRLEQRVGLAFLAATAVAALAMGLLLRSCYGDLFRDAAGRPAGGTTVDVVPPV